MDKLTRIVDIVNSSLSLASFATTISFYETIFGVENISFGSRLPYTLTSWQLAKISNAATCIAHIVSHYLSINSLSPNLHFNFFAQTSYCQYYLLNKSWNSHSLLFPLILYRARISIYCWSICSKLLRIGMIWTTQLHPDHTNTIFRRTTTPLYGWYSIYLIAR